MSFYETPVRRFCIVRACGLFVLALGIGAFSFAPDVDSQGRIFCYAVAGLCVLMGLFNLRQARQSPPDATITTIPDRAPIPTQIHYFRRMLWLSAIAFPALTAWVAYDLQQLESGATVHARIWAPLAPIYEHFGYWPTVIALPLLGIVCCTVFTFKLRKRKAMNTETTARTDTAAESGVLCFDGSLISYTSQHYGSFSLPLSEIAVIGEFTTDNGPVIDDWFLVFVRRTGGEWFEASEYAVGTQDVLQRLSTVLGDSLRAGLSNSMDFSSRILWPTALADRPLFTFSPVTASTFLRRIKPSMLPQVSHSLSPDALSAIERSA
jgi:hypothetical protein